MIRYATLLLALSTLASPRGARAQGTDTMQGRRLVTALRAENAESSLRGIESLRGSTSRTLESSRLLPSLNCVEVELREARLGDIDGEIAALADDAAADRIGRLANALSGNLIDLIDAYDRCLTDGPCALEARDQYAARIAEMRRVRPRTRALAASVHPSRAEHRVRMGETLRAQQLATLRKLRQATHDDGPHGFDLARAYLTPLHLPPQPLHWRARTFVPAIATWGAAAGVGTLSLIGSITILGPEGPGAPLLVSAGFGFLLSGGVAAVSAYTWERPSLAIWLTAAIATTGTGALGLFALMRGDRRRRYLGRGLLAGSGLSVFWLVGGLVHLTHEARVERAWRRYLEGPVRVAPAIDAHTAGLTLHGRF